MTKPYFLLLQFSTATPSSKDVWVGPFEVDHSVPRHNVVALQRALVRKFERVFAGTNMTADVRDAVLAGVAAIALDDAALKSENLAVILAERVRNADVNGMSGTGGSVEKTASGKIALMEPTAETLIREAGEVAQKDSYDFTDLLGVVTAETVARNFTEWVAQRFFEEAEAGFEFEVVRGGRAGQQSVPVEESPWVKWTMVGLTSTYGRQGLAGAGVKESGPHIQMSKYTAEDRGPGSQGPVVAFPLDVLFGERKRQEEYEEYLRLRAIYEPDQIAENGKAAGDGVERLDSDDENVSEHKAQSQARAAQVLGLPDPLAGFFGPSESDRQP